MAKWSAQTYEMVANGIRNELELAPPEMSEDAYQALRRIAVYFTGQFTADSRTFKRDQFLQACGIDKSSSRQ